MFPSIDDNLICERVLGWNLVDGTRDVWRLPDGSLRAGTPRFTTDAALTRAIEAALAESEQSGQPIAMPPAGLFEGLPGPDIGERDADEGDWSANYHLECAIARATRRLIERANRARN